MLNGISRSFTRSKVVLGRSPSGVAPLLLTLRGHPQFPGIASSFRRSIATKPEQHHKLKAHFEARKVYVDALGTRFVPDLPAREVQALSRRVASLLHPAVRNLPAFPCPNLATLKLDEALKDGQWLLIRPAAANHNQTRVTLRTLLPREGVTTSSLYIPQSVLEGADAIWLCPYFDPETLTLRLRKASGDDSTVIFTLKQLVITECGRSLAKLAFSGGLIPSATYISDFTEVQQSQMVDEVGAQVQEGTKVSESTSEHLESEPSFRYWRYRLNTCEAIKTLRRSEVLAQQQVLCFDKVLTRTMSQIIVDKKQAGRVNFTFPKRLLPQDGSVFYCCPYFDQELEKLRYCTPDGEDIPGISVSIMQMARSKDLRSALLLAKAEGMISKLPDGYAKTLQLDKALASGYVIELQLPTETVADVTLSLYLGPLMRTASFKSRVIPGGDRTRVQLVPYVHASGNLRLWDKEKSQDWELEPGKVFEKSPRVVKAVSPFLFDLGVREGFWALGLPGRQGKKRDPFEMLENLGGLAGKLLEGAYAIYS